MKFKKGELADKMDKTEKIELEYYELCPECGKEPYVFQHLDCESIECEGVCFADRKKIVRDGVIFQHG